MLGADYFKSLHPRNSLVAQWVKDPVLSLLWHRFSPWHGTSACHRPDQKKKKKKKTYCVLVKCNTCRFSNNVQKCAGYFNQSHLRVVFVSSFLF